VKFTNVKKKKKLPSGLGAGTGLDKRTEIDNLR
jgi:hypothetical protein